ncbi:MAG TPA: hypothetical protein VGB18_00315 [Candidatus Thermoplasmatota archaeon]
MQTTTSIWVHWCLFAAAMLGAGWLVVLGYLNLDAAFSNSELTRQTLFESLTYLAAVLALLWAAGWVVASRPKAPPRVEVDGYTYA